jgi:hypothetical protein
MEFAEALSNYQSFKIWKFIRRSPDGFPMRWHWNGVPNKNKPELPRSSPQFGFASAEECLADFLRQVDEHGKTEQAF